MSLLLELKPGAPISVTYLDTGHKMQTVQMIYVGLIDQEYLILKFPDKRALVNHKFGLVPGTHLTLRTMVAKDMLHAISFKAPSLGVSKLREPLLLVAFPSQTHSQQLRSKPRLKVEAMAGVRLLNKDFEFLTMVSDFSLTGLKCEFNLTEAQESQLNKNTISELVDERVSIDFGVNDDFESDFQLYGMIKNARIQDKALLGIQFENNDESMVKSVFAILLMRLHGL
ncbi:hypothetical protein DS2_08053 [Catenovulum agarivorans DS-2]|uniref:PilZ domain-containing protein n=1 Tax=Catenovulum agarivorans DS-2 TaxID=1328313 RepID=W7QYH0_9ALTE|nr:PilZ domain-containing protein [Catenovulum agarivorans]EWH10410.1 hypothetical protein DS2_08053 [Catenovulum agarivorans DS-2]